MANLCENKVSCTGLMLGDMLKNIRQRNTIFGQYGHTIDASIRKPEGVLEVIGCGLSSVVYGLHSCLAVPSSAVLQQIARSALSFCTVCVASVGEQSGSKCSHTQQ